MPHVMPKNVKCQREFMPIMTIRLSPLSFAPTFGQNLSYYRWRRSRDVQPTPVVNKHAHIHTYVYGYAVFSNPNSTRTFYPQPETRPVFNRSVITLRTKLSGVVYCYRSSLQRAGRWRLWPCGSVTTITRNCFDNSKLRASIFTKLGL